MRKSSQGVAGHCAVHLHHDYHCLLPHAATSLRRVFNIIQRTDHLRLNASTLARTRDLDTTGQSHGRLRSPSLSPNNFGISRPLCIRSIQDSKRLTIFLVHNCHPGPSDCVTKSQGLLPTTSQHLHGRCTTEPVQKVSPTISERPLPA